MDERILKWLFDIKIAVEEINGYFDNKPSDFAEYQKNLMLKRAVERNLEIIGEAISRIIKKDESFIKNISDAKAIIGLRNQVIHAYDRVSDQIIWSVLLNHLPNLKTEIDNLIKQ